MCSYSLFVTDSTPNDLLFPRAGKVSSFQWIFVFDVASRRTVSNSCIYRIACRYFFMGGYYLPFLQLTSFSEKNKPANSVRPHMSPIERNGHVL